MFRLGLDHLTVIDTTPVHLTQVAHAAGCAGMCLFLHPMAELPLMPRFDIVGDRAVRAEARAVMADLGVTLDLAYPFSLGGRTDLAAFAPAMDCAADLGARLLNVLVYDRDAARRADTFGRFCDMAARFGHRVAVEFYPPSQVPSLAAALDLVGQVGRPGAVGVNVDLLHLMRSGGTVADLAAAGDRVLYAQVADGPLMPPADLVREASSERQLCGEGAFDVAGFMQALPPGCPFSVEIPRDHAAGVLPPQERARVAADSVRATVEKGA
ncbi:MAG: TIM barrel protein [Novosphingobium sp.]|nr:TIM barrel protein [Novosphingobium sp.]